MNKGYSLIILFLVNMLFLSCHKDNEYDVPMILMGEPTNIDSTGVTLNFRISDLGKSPIKEFGVLWTENWYLKYGEAECEPVAGTASVGNYSVRLKRSLLPTELRACAYIKNNEGIVSSRAISFIPVKSLAPTISRISPKTARMGDAITVYGSGFHPFIQFLGIGSQSDYCEVGITTDDGKTTTRVSVIESDLSYLKFKLPYGLQKNKYRVYVSYFENKIFSSDEYFVSDPIIESITPIRFHFNDTLTIKGFNFSPIVEQNKFQIYNKDMVSYEGYRDLKIISATENTLKAIAVQYFYDRSANFKITTNNMTSSYDDKYLIFDRLYVSDIIPKSGSVGDTISIYGENFIPFNDHNIVIFGNNPATVIYSSQNMIKVIVPEKDIYFSGKINIHTEFNDLLYESYNYSYFRYN